MSVLPQLFWLDSWILSWRDTKILPKPVNELAILAKTSHFRFKPDIFGEDPHVLEVVKGKRNPVVTT